MPSDDKMAESAAQLFSRLGAKELLRNLDLPFFSQLSSGTHGLLPGDVVEFCGFEGTGKSEILLNIAVQCVLNKSWHGQKLGGKETEVVFISTDYKFDLLRLTMILEGHVATKMGAALADQTDSSDYKELILSCLSRVHVVHCSSSAELVVTLQSLKTFFHNHSEVCVLILDNVASYYWIDRDKTAFGGTTATQWITSLSELIQDYHLVVFAAKPLLVNRSVMSSTKGTADRKVKRPIASGDVMPKPWQRLVKYRFHLDILPNSLVEGGPTFVAHQTTPIGPVYKFRVCGHGLAFIS